jgi:hypothetical protein
LKDLRPRLERAATAAGGAGDGTAKAHYEDAKARIDAAFDPSK